MLDCPPSFPSSIPMDGTQSVLRPMLAFCLPFPMERAQGMWLCVFVCVIFFPQLIAFAHFNYIFSVFYEFFRKFLGTCETRGHPGRAVLMKTCLEVTRVVQTQQGVVCICINTEK